MTTTDQSVFDKAVEIFGDDMGTKHGCLFKAWAQTHLQFYRLSFEWLQDPYEIIENLLFPVYAGFEMLVDSFILEWASKNPEVEEEVDLQEITKDLLRTLGVGQCLLVSQSLFPEN
jgi:hypothetical protein